MPNRTQQVLPLAYGSVILITAAAFGLTRRGRAAPAVIAALLVAWNAQANTRLFLSEYIAFERDKAVAYRIAERLSVQGWSGAAVPLVIFGRLAQPEERYMIKSETIGASYFEYDDGRRASFLLSILGYQLRFPTPLEVRSVIAGAEAMPEWPEPGSIALIDGTAVVKFGTPTATQLPSIR